MIKVKKSLSTLDFCTSKKGAGLHIDFVPMQAEKWHRGAAAAYLHEVHWTDCSNENNLKEIK